MDWSSYGAVLIAELYCIISNVSFTCVTTSILSLNRSISKRASIYGNFFVHKLVLRNKHQILFVIMVTMHV